MCIVCFLKNENQFLLRHSAMLRTDRFEHMIETYKNEFIDNFKSSRDKLCNRHNNEIGNYIKVALEELDFNNIKEFFDSIKKIYINWINAEISISIDILESIILKHKLDIFSEELKSKLLFRGRKSDSFISHWDMFHIPFNRRFLIRNQRYSLIGQPILYFATSPYGVFKEIGEYKDLKISRFMINEDNKFKIFENVNKFEYYIGEESDFLSNIINVEELSDKSYVKSMFYLMILSSCCSFSRREDTKKDYFSEEYIIPQILTIVLKQMRYDGIKYTSTKLYDETLNIDMDNKMVELLYNNYCIFTNYKPQDSRDKTYVYDKALYKKFDISNVITCENSINSNLFNIDTLKDLIVNIDETEYYQCYNKDIIYLLAEELDSINRLKNCIEGKSDSNKIMVNLINMHILFIRDIILNIKSNRDIKES